MKTLKRPEVLSPAGDFEKLETALRFGIAKRTLDEWRRNAEGPAYISKGKLTLYKVADVADYLNDYRIDPEGR